MNEDVHDRVIGELREYFPTAEFEIPPPVFRQLGGRIVAYEDGRELRSRWPLPDWCRGPKGYVQGGYLEMLFDNSYGPLAYLVARTVSRSLSLATEFVRPLGPEEDSVDVRVHLVDRTRRFLLLDGEALNGDGKLVAGNRTRMVLLPGRARS